MKRLALGFIFFILLTIHSSGNILEAKREVPLPQDLTVPADLLKRGEMLSIDEATRLAVADNLDIQMVRLEREGTQKDTQIADGVYDTQMELAGTYSQDKAERASLVSGSRELEGIVQVGFQKKIPLGTDVGVSVGTIRRSSSSSFTTLDRNYSSFMEVSVTQPLLRNFFGYIDRKQIEQVKINVKKFDYETLDRIESSVIGIRNQYWDLVFAYEDLKAKLDALGKAQDFFRITKEKLDIGTAEEPDVYAAEANVRNRVVQALEAETQLNTHSYSLKVLLGGIQVDLILPSDRPEFKVIEVQYEAALSEAMEQRRDLKQMELSIEDQVIERKIKWNERLPELEFAGTWASTSLDREMASSQGEVFSGNHPQYFGGVTMTSNLELRAERGSYSQAEYELARLRRELEKLKLVIGQELDKSYRTLKLAEERVRQTREIENLQRKKLTEEEKDFNVGRSDSKTIIDFQDDVIKAETEAILALVDYVKAVDGFYRSKHTLLEWVGVTDRQAVEGEKK